MEEDGIRRFLKHRKSMSQTQFIAFGFSVLILSGVLLLMLLFVSRDGESVGFLDALFTATSVSCATGLVVVDTWSQWMLFGQLVILAVIQIGGLGFITVGVLMPIILRRRIGLKQRGPMQESTSALKIGGVVKLVEKTILGAPILEVTGVVLLAFRFVSQYGPLKGIFYGIFHSIFVFCNAGSDLMGNQEPYSLFVAYCDDWLANLVIMMLIIVGGIGFIVWDDVNTHEQKVKKYLLQTKVVLLTMVVLVFGGAFLFYLFEKGNLLAGISVSGKVLSSLFGSATARTAGFNTTDVVAMSDGGKPLTMILMFIGGSPGSTAGGVKTMIIVVLLLYVASNTKRIYGVNVFGRRLEDDVVKRASAILTTNLFLVLSASLVIMGVQTMSMADATFETFSAIGTVGMTMGIIRDLIPLSRVIVIILMHCSRIGSLSFAPTFTQQKKIAHVQQPVERITVGQRGEVNMKSVLVVGMGRFGRHLCMNLSELGNEIMIVDAKEEILEEPLPYMVSARIGGCTNKVVLRSLGIINSDLILVCTGTNFQNSLGITNLVKELGGRHVISKANRDIHAKFLLRNGVDEVIYLDGDIAERLTVCYSANHVLDYIGLTDEFSIYEILPLPKWVGKNLAEANIRHKHHISVSTTKKEGKARLMPPATCVIQEDEHLMVIGKKMDIDSILKKLP